MIVGTEIQLVGGPTLVLLAKNFSGYQPICQMIDVVRRRAKKGAYELSREDVRAEMTGGVTLWILGRTSSEAYRFWSITVFDDRLL